MLEDKPKIITSYSKDKVKGIYLLFNKCNNKFYIGSSINLNQRLKTYYYPSKLKDNRLISKSIIKYGHANFSLYILEIYKDDVIEILEREQYYINLYKPEYNILRKAGNSLGYKHSEETKRKITVSKMGKVVGIETRNKLSELFKGENNPFFGKKHSEETKRKLSESRKGEKNPMFGKVKSLEFLASMIKPKPVYVYYENSKELIIKYDSRGDAIKGLKISSYRLKKCIELKLPFNGQILSPEEL